MSNALEVALEVQNKFREYLIQIVASETKNDATIANDPSTNGKVAIINCQTEDRAESFLSHINQSSVKLMSDFIEKETGKSAKRFNRSFVLFESQVNKDNVTLRWT